MTRRDLTILEEDGRRVVRCAFCGVAIGSGRFCRQCVALGEVAMRSLERAIAAETEPGEGRLVERNGPHSLLIRQPTGPDGTPQSWETV